MVILNKKTNAFILRMFFLILLLFASLHVFAQNKQASIWHVGNKKLNFNTNPITVTDLSYPYQGVHSSIALADINGNYILFASHQTKKLYDNNFLKIPLSDITFGNKIRKFMFIPNPNNPNLIYLFYDNRYALIDISNYTIVEKDIIWHSQFNNSIYAIHHANCKDIWLISQQKIGFYSYLISETGISTTPIFSEATNYVGHRGTFSPTGKYFAILNNVTNSEDTVLINFGQFDRQSGELTTTNSYKFTNYGMCFASAFSPDETKLYLFMQIRNKNTYHLYQVNIINGVPDFENAINISTQTIFGFDAYSSMQLGIDGKIYQTYYYSAKKINIIHNPNNLGVACNYQDNAIPLTTTLNSLPIFISTWLSETSCILDFSYFPDCSLEKMFLINNTNNIQSVFWNFGDGTTSTEQNPTHTYTSAGTYTVNLTVTYTDGTTQTVNKTVKINKIPKKPIIIHN